MKKVFYILFAGLLMLPIGCNEQNDSAPELAGDMIRFGASQVTSKVDFNTDPAGATVGERSNGIFVMTRHSRHRKFPIGQID